MTSGCKKWIKSCKNCANVRLKQLVGVRLKQFYSNSQYRPTVQFWRVQTSKAPERENNKKFRKTFENPYRVSRQKWKPALWKNFNRLNGVSKFDLYLKYVLPVIDDFTKSISVNVPTKLFWTFFIKSVSYVYKRKTAYCFQLFIYVNNCRYKPTDSWGNICNYLIVYGHVDHLLTEFPVNTKNVSKY